MTFTWTYGPVDEGDLDGPIVNTATATHPDADPASAGCSVAIVTSPSLEITKEANATSANIGDTINYTIIVTNTGDVTLTNVTVTDPLIGLDESIESLAAGDSQTFYGSHVVTEDDLPGPLVNTASAASDETLDAVEASWTVSLIAPEEPTPTPVTPTPPTPTPVTPTPPAPTPQPCLRTDVSVVIYGGWDGIPVMAWVGGTEQPTLHTSGGPGQAAVTWTFYPPEGAGWLVQVAPQAPPAQDNGRWHYRLLRLEIETPQTGLRVINDPANQVQIQRCSRYVFYYQLVDSGQPTPTPGGPILILPVAGDEAGQATARSGLIEFILSVWQWLARWLTGLFTR
jgi:hypothetical protein